MANKVFLAGRLTKDPEMRYTTNNNTAVCSFNLAVDRRFKKEGDQSADFISIVAWSKTAEFCAKYFCKGQKVIVIGRIRTRTWEDNDGKKHYITEVVAEEVDFADGKKSGGTGDAYEPSSTPQSSGGGFYQVEDEDDDLPF